MKRYLLFYSSDFYPAMGMNDLQGTFDSIKECHESFEKQQFKDYTIYHIFDYETKKIVFNGSRTDYISCGDRT